MTAVRHVDDDERRRRLVRRHHLGRTAATCRQAVADVLAMHSSDPLTPFLGLRARVPDLTIAAIDAALYEERGLWRLHAMRRTLWIVDRDDAPAVLAGSTAKVAAAERRRLHGWLGALDDHPAAADPAAWLADLEAAVHAQLADGPMATRELSTTVPGFATKVTLGTGRWAQEAAIGPRLLFLMAMDGDPVRGAPLGTWRASQYVWHAHRQRFGTDPPTRPSTDQAQAQLARRHLDRFGPVTEEDLAWWMGWTKAETRRALSAVSPVEVTTDAGPAWVLPGDDGPEPPLDAPAVALLPGLDPSTMGWKARDFYLGDHGAALFDRNGNAGPTIWLDGRVVGGWAQGPDGGVRTRLLEDVGADAAALVDAEAAAVGAWIGDDGVTPRFRTPLERELSGA
ncbi:winged helix DNA-binding domain-containing protein [Euzebya sp.]|uniref:winged helix DNA-binding domain-containing protein n=1 Tax=Euzebya sp. TaxID=1971409 RepID=UPI003513C92A